MNIGVAIALGGGGVEKARLIFARQVESISGSLGTDIQCFGTEPRVIGGTGRGREVEEIVDLSEVEGLADILLDQGESRFIFEAGQIGCAPGGEIVHPYHLVTLGKKGIAEMRAEEAGSAGDQDTMSRQNKVSPVLESIVPQAESANKTVGGTLCFQRSSRLGPALSRG